MRRLVKNIRSIEAMLPYKQVDVSLAQKKLGRSLVSAMPIAPGIQISERHLVLKSPGDGIRWRDRHKIVGKVARRPIPADVTLDESDVVEPRDVDDSVAGYRVGGQTFYQSKPAEA